MANWRRRTVFIAGTGMSDWGFYPETECSEYGSRAILGALQDAEMSWPDVQAAYCGTVYQGTGAGHRVVREVGLTGIPIVNVENACSSSAAALRLAFQQVAAEIYDVVLVFGIERSPRGPIASTAFDPWELQAGFNFQPGNYALEVRKYMEEVGATEEDLSRVTVKNRKNASLTSFARFKTPVTLEEVLTSRMVAPPLRLLHCAPLADGASAAVVCSESELRLPRRAVTVAASALTSAIHGEEYVPGGIVGSVRYPSDTNLVRLSAQQAYEASGYGPEDVDVVQAYDTVSAAELWDLEDLGFCGVAEAPGLLREGVFDLTGKLPVNTDGGLMGRGHPLGATGLGQVCELVRQLRGEAGPRQVAKARVGLAHAMGAGPNSSVTILAR